MNNKTETLNYYHNISADFFEENSDQTIVLHHIDPLLKYKDYARYDEWRINDVVPMTQADHMRLHHKGIAMSKAEYIKRKQNMEYSVKNSVKHRKMIIKATNGKQLVYFNTQQECADFLGCSRQQVYYVMSPKWTSYQKACGWKLSWTRQQKGN